MRRPILVAGAAVSLVAAMVLNAYETTERSLTARQVVGLELRGLAACHSCPSTCATGSGGQITCSNSSTSCPDDQNFCDAANQACGNFSKVARGPYNECVDGGGPLAGACSSVVTKLPCYDKTTCTCSDWAYDECDCGPYTITQTADIREGCS